MIKEEKLLNGFWFTSFQFCFANFCSKFNATICRWIPHCIYLHRSYVQNYKYLFQRYSVFFLFMEISLFRDLKQENLQQKCWLNRKNAWQSSLLMLNTILTRIYTFCNAMLTFLYYSFIYLFNF